MEVQGRDAVFFAGAYAYPGAGLLEQALASAEVAVASLESVGVLSSEEARNRGA